MNVAFATEGAPLIVGDRGSVARWRGSDDDGSGVVVEVWARGIEKLPAKLKAKLKKGRGQRLEAKLPNAEAGAQLEAELLAALLKLHPGAARPPPYPDYATWYLGDYTKNDRVFGIDRTFTTALSGVLKKLKGDVASVVVDKKAKASALFFAIEGGGQSVLVVRSGAVAVAKLASADGKMADVVAALENNGPGKTKPAGKIALGEILVAADAGLPARCYAGLDVAGTHGGVRGVGQEAPAGAYAKVVPGRYNHGVARTNSYDVLWLWA
ncbi:MAG: hypothetical protein JNK82_09415 [Myxococcaceae bacterium]|nr:hypothetical protein [Myxococcaceae bacterium]